MLQILKLSDGDPVAVENKDAKGPVLLVCEHASRTLPSHFGTMGLTHEALDSHIAWDPGALAVSRLLVEKLDAALIYQRFSRLVYDCNRPPEADAAMPAISEIFPVPGNADISPEERQARADALYFPFREAITGFMAERRKAGRPCVLVTIHSFTPVYHGVARAIEVGILHDTDKRLADLMLTHGEGGPFEIRRNEPYGPADGVTHTLIEHGIKTGRFNVMIEIRNDLIEDEAGQGVMAGYLADLVLKSIVDLAKAQN